MLKPLLLITALALLAAGCGDAPPRSEAAPSKSVAPPKIDDPFPKSDAPPKGDAPPKNADTGASAAKPSVGGKVGSSPGSTIPAFQARVRRPDGKAAREEPFDSRARKSATLYILNSTTCPYCDGYADRMKALESYMAKGVDIVHVYSLRKETDKIDWHAKHGFTAGQIIDADASIARSFATEKTPTAYLVDSKGVVVYRGAIDDSPSGADAETKPHLANAMDALLAGKPVAVAETEPVG